MLFEDIFLSGALAAFYSAEQNHLFNFSRGCYEEQFCEIILNLDWWFRRRCRLKIFLNWRSGVQGSRTICAFWQRVSREQFCEIILHLYKWFKKCHLKDFLSGALMALVLGGAEPFMQFW